MSDTISKGTALITGASSGIGAIYADRLARRGYDLILVARSTERLQDVARRITDATGRSVNAVTADLGKAEDLRRVEAVLRDNAAITMLVNNAGFGAATPLVATDVDEMEDMIDLNVTALTRLTYAAAPRFAERGEGTIINIASIVAIGPEILNGVYGATKAFVLALTQSLQHELADKGVRVQAVLPGYTRTAMIAGRSDIPDSYVMGVEDMVDAALAGFDQGELVTIPSLRDPELYEAYASARVALRSQLSLDEPAPRYGVGERKVA